MIAPNEGSVAVTVRLHCGSYVSSFGGQRPSCTMSAEQAALRLAQKLWPGAEVRCELLWFGRLEADHFVDALKWVFGLYCAGNVASKFTGEEATTDGR